MVPIDDFCYYMSSEYVYEDPYVELVDAEICDKIDASISQYVC